MPSNPLDGGSNSSGTDRTDDLRDVFTLFFRLAVRLGVSLTEGGGTTWGGVSGRTLTTSSLNSRHGRAVEGVEPDDTEESKANHTY